MSLSIEKCLKEAITVYGENTALVHYGHRKSDPFTLSLVEVDSLSDVSVINWLQFVEPDFMLFQQNKFIWNDMETRVAGCPDLVVEIWSKSNILSEREAKFLIYSSSNKTEHWYIEQDSNEVSCYKGSDKLDNQTLNDILCTQDGLKFDLTHIAL